MKNYKLLTIWAILILLLPITRAITVLPDQDTWVWERASYESTNYGTAIDLTCQNEDGIVRDAEVFIQINLTEGKTVTTAQLSLFLDQASLDSGSDIIEVYYCNDTFREMSLTWANKLTEVINCANNPFYSIADNVPVDEEWWTLNMTNITNDDADGLYTLRIIMNGSVNGVDLSLSARTHTTASERPMFNYTESAPPVVNETLDLLFKNHTSEYKTTFDEGENFKVFANYTFSNGSVIDNVECNFSLINGISEVMLTKKNFSICSVGCNYSIYQEEINLESTWTSLGDYFYFEACHAQLPQENFYINLSCQSGTELLTIPPSAIPLCSIGNPPISYFSTVCSARQKINITFLAPIIFNRRKIISNFEIDREFNILRKEFGIDTFYNSTSKLYESNEDNEYYIHGTKNITVNCSKPNAKSVQESIIIVNELPQIFVGGILINETIFPLTTIPFNFFSPWNFLITVVDDDISLINISIKNKSETIYSRINTSSFGLLMNSSQLRDFANNPLELSVNATDPFGTVFWNSSFTITDNTAPECFGFLNISIENNTLLPFEGTCFDESFFSFMINCSNGYGFMETGLFTNKYIFNESTIFMKDSICYIEVWDGHTLEALDEFIIPSIIEDKSVSVYIKGKENTFRPITGIDFVTPEITKEIDRIQFTYDWKELDSKLPTLKTFQYTTSSNSYYNPSDKYKGWIVDFDSKTWFDANLKNDPKASVIVNKLNQTTWRIDIWTIKNRLEFESIGQLNNNTYNFEVDVYIPFGARFEVDDCPTTTAETMLIGIVMFLGLALLIIGMSHSIFGIFGAIIWLISSFPLMGCSRTIGLAFAGVSIIAMLFYAVKQQ